MQYKLPTYNTNRNVSARLIIQMRCKRPTYNTTARFALGSRGHEGHESQQPLSQMRGVRSQCFGTCLGRDAGHDEMMQNADVISRIPASAPLPAKGSTPALRNKTNHPDLLGKPPGPQKPRPKSPPEKPSKVCVRGRGPSNSCPRLHNTRLMGS